MQFHKEKYMYQDPQIAQLWVPCSNGQCCNCGLADGFRTKDECMANHGAMPPHECCYGNLNNPGSPAPCFANTEGFQSALNAPNPDNYDTLAQTWTIQKPYTL